MNRKLTGDMFKAARSMINEILDHPFVKGLADGSLSDDRFRYYMMQDYLYLYEYARLYAIGVLKADSIETMMRYTKNLDSVLNEEMTLHREYMKKIGITEAQIDQIKPALASISYTSYMLSAAEKGTAADITIVILACSWSYAEIGKKLAGANEAREHPVYGEWIKMYSAPEYQNVNRGLIDFVEVMNQDIDKEKELRLTEIFLTCCRYELAFFDMAWNMSS